MTERHLRYQVQKEEDCSNSVGICAYQFAYGAFTLETMTRKESATRKDGTYWSTTRPRYLKGMDLDDLLPFIDRKKVGAY